MMTVGKICPHWTSSWIPAIPAIMSPQTMIQIRRFLMMTTISAYGQKERHYATQLIGPRLPQPRLGAPHIQDLILEHLSQKTALVEGAAAFEPEMTGSTPEKLVSAGIPTTSHGFPTA